MMKKISSTLILLLILVFSCQAQDDKQVQKTFKAYKSAILNGNGKEAASYVDSHTINYYARMLDITRHADSAQVDTMSILDKIIILTLRAKVKKEQLHEMDGKSLIVYAINTGMIGKNTVNNFAIDHISVNKNFAQAQMMAQGQPIPMYMHFYKENGQWRVDLTSLFKTFSEAMAQLIEESGQTENEFLVKMLEASTGKTLDRKLWQPLE